MSNEALLLRLDRDMFKGEHSPEELQRRLNMLVEQLYDMFAELGGGLLQNPNITYFGSKQALDPNDTMQSQGYTPRSITFNAVDDNGRNVRVKINLGGVSLL